jgi:hypothetical protein
MNTEKMRSVMSCLPMLTVVACPAALWAILASGCANGSADGMGDGEPADMAEVGTDGDEARQDSDVSDHDVHDFFDGDSENNAEADADIDEADAVICEKRCHAEQACIDGQCTFSCSGVWVPGDYADIQAAVDALQPAGGTICLRPVTFTEEVYIRPAAALHIVGASADRTIIDGSISVGEGSGDATITLQGMGVTRGVRVTNLLPFSNDVKLLWSMISNPDGCGLDIYGNWNESQVLVDGCDISADPSHAAVRISRLRSGTSLSVTIQNSYLHAAAAGVDVDTDREDPGDPWSGPRPGDANAVIEILNDTLLGHDTALLVATPLAGVRLDVTYANTVIASNGIGIDLTGYDASTAVHRSNALYGNTTNYAGTAVPGPDYVTEDPLLDMSVAPPELLPGSPCRGAGDPDLAPPTDFWGTIRSGSIDIGAVQSAP